MRTSQYLLATLKETPADAEVVSHQLMLRAGMIRRVSSGIYTWLPLGLKVLRKVERIVREEMNKSGALEVLMPSVQPAELWQESERWDAFGPELLRLQDRHERDFCLGPTHEEVITSMLKNELKSYKQLPLNLYQIQTKFRDEVRPRFGVMRSREFVMKDAYSFHIDAQSLKETYDVMYETYCRIFDRIGLQYRAVIADSGAIGGDASHEFHVLADSGEDAIMFSDSSAYASNIESAAAVAMNERQAPSEEMRLVDTPDTKTIAALVEKYNMPIEKTIKTLVVRASQDCDSDFVALLVRGDHALNEIKAEKLDKVASPLVMATEQEIRDAIGAGPGSLGPVNLPIPFIVDKTVAQMSDFGAGANIDDKHYFGINWERDVALSEVADIRNVKVGDPSPDGQGNLQMARGIEVGHIFQLGDKYSQKMNATVLDSNGKAVAMSMGCYGIGATRVVAAAIEQNHDEKGIIWPMSIAPFQISIVAIGYQKSEQVKAYCDEMYTRLTQAGVDVLLDDRNERPGVMFADMELIGVPYVLVVGDRALQSGALELRHRKQGTNDEVPVDQAYETCMKIIESL